MVPGATPGDAGELSPSVFPSMWRNLSSTSRLRSFPCLSAPLLLVLFCSPSRAADIDDGLQLTVEQALKIAALSGEVDEWSIRLHKLMRGGEPAAPLSEPDAAVLHDTVQLLTMGKLVTENVVAVAYGNRLEGTGAGRLLAASQAWGFAGDGARCLAQDVRREPVDGAPPAAAPTDRVGYRVQYVCIAPHMHKSRALAQLMTAVVQGQAAPSVDALEQSMLAGERRDEARPRSMNGSLHLSSDAHGRNWTSSGAIVSEQLLAETQVPPTAWMPAPVSQAESVRTAVQELMQRMQVAGETSADLQDAIAAHLLLRFPEVLWDAVREDVTGLARAVARRAATAECRVQEVQQGEDRYEAHTVRLAQAALTCTLPALEWTLAPLDAHDRDATALAARYRQFLQRATETIATSPAHAAATAVDFQEVSGPNGDAWHAEPGALPKLLLEGILPAPLVKELGGLALNADALHPDMRFEHLDGRNLDESGRVLVRRFLQELRAARRVE